MSNLAITNHFVEQLESGNPIQALLWANGAARECAALRKVLADRARRELGAPSYQAAKEVCEQLLAGCQAHELSPICREQLELLQRCTARQRAEARQQRALIRMRFCEALKKRPSTVYPSRAATRRPSPRGQLRTTKPQLAQALGAPARLTHLA